VVTRQITIATAVKTTTKPLTSIDFWYS
jgi:hypothetical protein